VYIDIELKVLLAHFISHILVRETVDTNINSKIQMNKCPSPLTGEVYSIHHYVIKFVSDLRQVGGFLWKL
jgi:hypothetical protein